LTQVSISFNARGGTHAILVRHEVVKDIEIPGNLHVYEDAFIKKWVLEKGHKVVATYAPYCIHFKPVEDWALRNSVSSAALEIKHGFLRYPRLYHLYSVVHWVIASLFSIPFNSQARTRGSRTKYIPPRCDTLRTHGICHTQETYAKEYDIY
jgi:hypothetical protein